MGDARPYHSGDGAAKGNWPAGQQAAQEVVGIHPNGGGSGHFRGCYQPLLLPPSFSTFTARAGAYRLIADAVASPPNYRAPGVPQKLIYK